MWGEFLDFAITMQGKHPTDMCMPESFQWTVRIPFFVRMRMMANVRCRPAVGSASGKCHASADQEESPQPFGSLKSLMRKHAMVTDRHAEAGEDPHPNENQQVGWKHVLLPCEHDGNADCEERQNDSRSDLELENKRAAFHELVRTRHGN